MTEHDDVVVSSVAGSKHHNASPQYPKPLHLYGLSAFDPNGPHRGPEPGPGLVHFQAGKRVSDSPETDLGAGTQRPVLPGSEVMAWYRRSRPLPTEPNPPKRNRVRDEHQRESDEEDRGHHVGPYSAAWAA